MIEDVSKMKCPKCGIRAVSKLESADKLICFACSYVFNKKPDNL